jgi:hypothetical protein
MEPQETTVEAIAENVAEAVEVSSAAKNTIAVPITATTEPAAQTIRVKPPAVDDTVSNDLWKQVTQLWEEYFGEGKKDNLTLAIIISATIPILIATSALLDFLNKLPLLPSVFELVGFGYSAWFVYRYLLLANTRKELIDAIAAWKNKVLG